MQASAERPGASIDLGDYDFELPPRHIAQQPCEPRHASKLMVLDRRVSAHTRGCQHAAFGELANWLEAGDLMILNTTRVKPARLRGHRDSGGAVEALLLGPHPGPPSAAARGPRYRAMVKVSGRLRPGIRMSFGPVSAGVRAQIAELGERGEVVLEFESDTDPYSVGSPPLPPYIRRPDEAEDARDRERYQTIYARTPGAIAAPTAGLHFSECVFDELAARGIERAEVVLHVGAGTFRPLDEQALQHGRLHSERYELCDATARAINRTRARGGRVVAVGTTSARVLEACSREDGQVVPAAGETDIFLRPGSRFAVVDALVTNFHLPRSSLLLLVAAFAGRERILAAYAEAIANDYRFFSYGDAMLIL